MMDPFRYVAPNETTAPKHAAVRAAATEATLLPLHPGEGCDLQGLFAHINERVKAFYDAILEQAPASADRSAAERCCRLARMLAVDVGHQHRLMSLARDQIMLARMQACAAIALNS
jgi:hypothetical protein